MEIKKGQARSSIITDKSIPGITSNGLIYGDFGTGKTYLGGTVQGVVRVMDIPQATLPEGWTIENRTILANAEIGDEGLPAMYTDIIIKRITNYKEYCRLFDFLKLHHKYLSEGNFAKLIELQLAYFGPKVKDLKTLFIIRAVIVDSLTEVQKYCVYDIRGINDNVKLDEEFDMMRIQDWGDALEKILLMIRKFRSLPMIKIFISQQQEDQDDKGRLFYRPALQGQAKLSILGFFDYAGYYTMKVTEGKVDRKLYLMPVGPFKAKNRFEEFTGAFMDNPTMSDILKYTIKKKSENKVENTRLSF